MENRIAARIRASREKAGLETWQLAEAVHRKTSAVVDWEEGRLDPGLEAIEWIAEATATDPAWLAFGVGEPEGTQTVKRHATVDIPVVSFVDGREYETVGCHSLSRDWLARALALETTAGLVAVSVDTDGIGPIPGSHCLVDTRQDEILGDGLYLLWTGRSAQLARIASVPGDFGSVSVLTRKGVPPGEIAADHLFVLGPVVGRLTAAF